MLAQIDDVKQHLGVADNSLDGIIAQLLPQADQMIKSWLRNQVEQATYTETCNGNNRALLRLRQPNVTSVASVYEDLTAYYGSASGAFGPATLLTAGVDYCLVPDQPDGSSKAGFLRRINAVWQPAFQSVFGLLTLPMADTPGSIQVTYTAGYATVPADLSWACNQLVAGLLKFRTGVIKDSESMEDYSYGAASPKSVWDIFNGLKPILAPYKSLRL